MTENRPRRNRTTNPADKRNCTGHLLLRPPTQNHPQSAQRNATPPDAARRLASHFGRRPHIIGRQRIPIRHPSAGTLVPTSNQGPHSSNPFEYPLKPGDPKWASHRHVPGPERYTGQRPPAG